MSPTAEPKPGEKPRLTLAESLQRQAQSRQDAQDAAKAAYAPKPPAEPTPSPQRAP